MNPGISQWLEQTSLCAEHDPGAMGESGFMPHQLHFQLMTDPEKIKATVTCGWDMVRQQEGLRSDNEKQVANSSHDTSQTRGLPATLGMGWTQKK